MKRAHVIWAFILTVGLVLLVAVGAWGIRQIFGGATPLPVNTPVSSPPNSTGNATQPQPETSPPQSYLVLVYFSKHPDSDNDPSKTFSVQRTTQTLGVATFAIQEVLKGPTSSESSQGYFSTVALRNEPSNCAGADFTLSIIDNVARLQFCRPFDHLGVVADGQADSVLKATLQQFKSVKKVIIVNFQGNCEFDLSGLNLCFK